jgi:flagellar motor protein MotB
MSDNPYRIEKSNEVKTRIRLLVDKYGMQEVKKHLSTTVASQKNKNEFITQGESAKLIHKAYNDRNYNQNTIEKLTLALNILGIPKTNEVFEGIKQGLKEAKEFMQGKDNGTQIYTPDGKELKGQEAVDYYQRLKKNKTNKPKEDLKQSFKDAENRKNITVHKTVDSLMESLNDDEVINSSTEDDWTYDEENIKPKGE